jgi:arylesterase/paraoxonase
MRRTVRGLSIAAYVIGITVFVLGGLGLQVLYATGHFKSLEPHFAGACTPIGGLVGAEDVTVNPETGVAYISATDRRAVRAGRPGRGAIYAYDLKSPSPRPRNLTPTADADFQPHGISLYRGGDGREVLYAINHAGGRHGIEIYDLVDVKLSHRATLSDPLLVAPNDLVAVGRDRLYVTNDHANAAGVTRVLEEHLGLPLSRVVHYDGARFVEAASGIPYANGINVSPDGRTLYVGSTTGGSVFVFGIDSASGALQERGEIGVGSGVDNIEIDEAGDLWIGAHPKLLRFVEHAGDASQHSPSQVIRVRAPDSADPVVEEIFVSLGADLSGASVGAVYRDRLLIGTVLDDHILDCRIKR